MNEQDTKIIELIKKNDSFALDVIYDQYAKLIFSAIYAKCKNKTLTEDLFQRTFVKIAEKRSKLVVLVASPVKYVIKISEVLFALIGGMPGGWHDLAAMY